MMFQRSAVVLNRKTALALAALLVLAACKVEVHDNLTQSDANEIAALLLFADIDAKRIEKKDGTFAVEVPEVDFANAVQLIGESGLPRPKFQSMVDVFQNDRLIASPSEERARLAYAMSQELSQTVSEIDGVISARVHLATPALDPLGRRVSKSSASVAIHHESALGTEGLVPRIKLLVSHAVDDLEYEDVLVALFPVKRSMPDRLSLAAVSARDEGGSDGLLSEMAWPEGESQAASVTQKRSTYVARAVVPETRPLNPAIAAILAGGLLVLLIAAKGLFDRPARRVRIEDDAESAAKHSPARRHRES
jgi:type III secretion protein J